MLNSFLDLIKVKIPLENKKGSLPYDPALPSLEKWKLVSTRTYTGNFVETLLIFAKSCKQPKCPPTGEWMNTLWYIYATSQEKEITNNANNNMNYTEWNKTLSKLTFFMIPFTWLLEKAKSKGMENRVQEWEAGFCKGATQGVAWWFFFKSWNVLYPVFGGGHTNLYMC